MRSARGSQGIIVQSRVLTLLGYFALMAGIYVWHLFIHNTAQQLISLLLLLQLGPLMFPLRGLLHGRVYTHAWSMYLAIFYFVIGVWYASSPESHAFGLYVVVTSLLFFLGSLLYSRFAARAVR